MRYLRLYFDCLAATLRAIARSPWTLLWPVALVGIYVPASVIAAPLGFIGGILLVLVYDALLASFLYVISELVNGSPVRLREMPQSMKPYFWPIMNVLFVLWVARFLLTPLLASQANSRGLFLGLAAVLFVLLNAVPEIIYQRGVYGGLATIGESIRFVQSHWIEWLPPNLAMGALFWFGLPWLESLPFGILWGALAGGAVLHAFMVFRGLLFRDLDQSNWRQRDLRARLGR